MFDPHDFLTMAKKIEQSASIEAEHRNCVGRAYYAAFLVTREYQGQRNIPNITTNQRGRRLGSHEQVIETVPNIRDRYARFYKNELYTLKSLRRKADYELYFVVSSTEAHKALLDAEAIIRWIDGLP